jgi:hypothetical protein
VDVELLPEPDGVDTEPLPEPDGVDTEPLAEPDGVDTDPLAEPDGLLVWASATAIKPAVASASRRIARVFMLAPPSLSLKQRGCQRLPEYD